MNCFTDGPLAAYELMMKTPPAKTPCHKDSPVYGHEQYAEALLRMAAGLGIKEFTNRVKSVIKDTETFYGGLDHKKRFAKLIKQEIINSGTSRSFAAALYLLTASTFLWNEIKPSVFGGRIDFKSFELGRLANGDWKNYTLYKMARAIYTNSTDIAYSDLCDKKIVGDKSFRLIINSFLICRYGVKAVRA